MVATKQTALPEIMDDICALVGENTIVLSLLNGVTSEEIIGNEIGMEHMLYSLMRIDAVRDGNHMELHFDRIAGVFFWREGSYRADRTCTGSVRSFLKELQ